MKKLSSVVGLFFSLSTLLCCALPILISIIAGGAAIGSLVATFPWLIPISQHKDWIFLLAGSLLIFNGIILYRYQEKVTQCELSGDQACDTASIWSRRIFWFSFILFMISAFMAYALVPILRAFAV